MAASRWFYSGGCWRRTTPRSNRRGLTDRKRDHQSSRRRFGGKQSCRRWSAAWRRLAATMIVECLRPALWVPATHLARRACGTMARWHGPTDVRRSFYNHATSLFKFWAWILAWAIFRSWHLHSVPRFIEHGNLRAWGAYWGRIWGSMMYKSTTTKFNETFPELKLHDMVVFHLKWCEICKKTATYQRLNSK